MRIVFATGNSHKVDEFRAILSKYLPNVEVVSMKDAGISDDIVEDGNTFEENAMIKARAVAAHGYIGIGDDSGLSVDALGGAPGIYSARYAGEHGNDRKNNAKLLCDMRGVDDRSARFVCTIACAFPKQLGLEDFTVRGECEGRIVCSEMGNGGFGYDPLFFVERYGKTFAQLQPDEKNLISHRAVATRIFAHELSERIGGIV